MTGNRITGLFKLSKIFKNGFSKETEQKTGSKIKDGMDTQTILRESISKTDLKTNVSAFFGITDAGLRRKKNEDTFLIWPEYRFCLVADGMGGESAGGLASHMFAQTALEIMSETNGTSAVDVIQRIKMIFTTANTRIYNHGMKNASCKGMGCTAELLGFSDEGFVVGHIGDSRTYRYRNNSLEQITQDHSMVQDQINKGLITPGESKNHALRHVILKAVGAEEKIIPDIISGNVRSGETFLLCSDGLTDMVTTEQIQKILSLKNTLSVKTKKLIDLAKSEGGHDNITVVLTEA